MPPTRFRSYKHSCEMSAKSYGIALAMNLERGERRLSDG